MSLIIKGFNMPKKDESLKIEIFPDGGIWVDEGRRYSRKENAVVEIPKEHGRLIDEKILDDTIERLNILTRYEYKIISNILFEIPTILEEEK